LDDKNLFRRYKANPKVKQTSKATKNNGQRTFWAVSCFWDGSSLFAKSISFSFVCDDGSEVRADGTGAVAVAGGFSTMSCTGEDVGRFVLIVGATVIKSCTGAEVGDSVTGVILTDPVVGSSVVGKVDAGGTLTDAIVGAGVVTILGEGTTGTVVASGSRVLRPQIVLASVIISVQTVVP
jgi:hypothetical protein